MVVKRYFHVQKLSFALCGVDTAATKTELILQRPFLCYIPLFFAIAHVVSILHYAYVNRHDYVEVTDSLALSCQSILAIWKMLIFLAKRKEFVEIINGIHVFNFKAGQQELPMIVSENKVDVLICGIYFWSVVVSACFAFMNPILEAILIYYKTERLVLREPYKASHLCEKLCSFTFIFTMVVKRYFRVQKLSFALCGIDTAATKPELILQRPFLCYIPLFFAIAHVVAILHYAYVNRHDYVEVTDSLALSCQSILAIWKMLIFLKKRREFVEIIKAIHGINFRSGQEELPLIVSENRADVKLCGIYFWTVVVAACLAFLSPILEAILIYYQTNELVLRVPYKATYFWNHSELFGYSLVYIWNVLSIYNLFGITLAIDTLFTWLVSNISAQFHILSFRFNEAAKSYGETLKVGGAKETRSVFKIIKSCLEYHNEILKLANKLNEAYGEIIFIKFIISCSEICCLVFRLSRPSESMAAAAYQGLFLTTVAMQLMLYCYNGQRIRDESLQVSPNIYSVFDWSCMTRSYKNLLLLPMMRSQNSTQLKGIFFVLDLNLFLWAFKTAGSLITALKTLEENQ